VSVAFNAGPGGLAPLPGKINNLQQVSTEDFTSLHTLGGQQGLVNRRTDEAELFKDADYVRNH
jgi:GH24 family phage-related lysozyme (muramidase)